MPKPIAFLPVVMAVVALSGVAWAQTPAGPEAVLDRVPAGAVVVVVIENAGKAGANADQFLKSVSPPDEPILPATVIEMIQAQFGIGEGFEPAGGFAAALLDPKPYGLELGEIFAGKRKDGSKITSDMVPLVVLIPGAAPAKLFALRKPTTAEGVVQFAGEDGRPRYCLEAGGHVVLGANLQAVKAVAAGGGSIRASLSQADQAFFQSHDASVWIDAARLAPLIAMRLVTVRGESKAGGGMLAALLALKGDDGAQWQAVLGQMQSAVVGLRFAKEGLYIEAAGAFRADSEMGKALAGGVPAGAGLFDRLPGPPYVLGLGVLNAPATPEKVLAGRIDAVLAAPPYQGLPDDAKARFRAAALALAGQVKSTQLHLGPLSSPLRLAYVIRCASSADARRQVAEIVAVAAQAVAAGSDKRLEGVSLTHQANAAKVAGRDADVITMSLASPTDAQRKRARALLGSESLRLVVVEAGPEALLIAQDGDAEALADAVAVAEKGSGRIPADAGVAKALALLPAKRTAAGVLNARHLQAVVKAVRAASGGKPVDVGIDSDVPFAGAVSVEGTSVRLTIVLPTETVREVMKVVSALLGAAAEGV